MIKDLTPERGVATDLIGKIRATSDRCWKVRRARVNPVEGRSTVLTLSSGKTPLGEIRARSSREASLLANANQVTLMIGWDHNRNEVLQVEFD